MFERLTDEVILIDGKYYRIMSDAEVVEFIWGLQHEENGDATAG